MRAFPHRHVEPAARSPYHTCCPRGSCLLSAGRFPRCSGPNCAHFAVFWSWSRPAVKCAMRCTMKCTVKCTLLSSTGLCPSAYGWEQSHVYEQDAHGAPVIRLRNRTKTLLSCRVPYLQFHPLSLDLDGLRYRVHECGCVVCEHCSGIARFWQGIYTP